jgi:hypothetical protein
VADWVTISALASAGGTLVLAGVTVASVRSANRAARVAELSLLAGQRPLLVTSRLEDRPQKAGFADDVWLHFPGGGAMVLATEEAAYFAFGIRNVGTGIAVLHGWHIYPDAERPDVHAPLEKFNRLTRDLYIAAGDAGFCQGAVRDPSTDDYAVARHAVDARERLIVDVLYGDFEGGQRVVTRFGMTPRGDEDAWLAGVARHWNVDRPNPR